MFMKVSDFQAIEKLIKDNADKYIDNAFYLDRFDSECKHCFVIRSNCFKSAIVFYSVEEFEKWIKG